MHLTQNLPTNALPWPASQHILALRNTRASNLGRRFKTRINLWHAKLYKQRLIDTFTQSPWAGAMFDKHPRLFLAPLEQYLDMRSNMRSRFSMTVGDLRFIDARLLAEKLHDLATDARIILFSDAQSGLYIDLGWNFEYPQEGMLLLTIKQQESGATLYSSSFSICNNHLFVGAIQGPRGENSQLLVRDATRALHGIRPHYFLVEILRQFVAIWKLEGLIGIDSRHQFKSHSKSFRANVVYFDYGAFWRDLGATREPGGNWQVPVHSTRKSIEEVESKKRAMYRRRFALLDTMNSHLLGIM